MADPIPRPTPYIVAEDSGDVRKHAPATLRNREAIAQVLMDALPPTGLVLEIASGSGEHVAHFARELPGHQWQPSDPDPSARESIAAWCKGLDNVRAPIAIDAAMPDWGIDHADAILCINMVHISPWQASLGLLAGAARILERHSALIVYGPFRRQGVPTAPSNDAFDQSLRARDPHWGVRYVESMTEAAAVQGLTFDQQVEMPANNLALVYRKA